MRIRTIKPEFWTSQDIGTLSAEERLLFIGLWSYVDDNGVGEDVPALIASALFPFDLSRDSSDTLARLSRGLQKLFSAGLIVRYTCENRSYLEIINWKKHQRIDKPNKPRFPQYSNDSRDCREIVANPPETLAPGTGEQGNRGTDITPCSAPLLDEGQTSPETSSASPNGSAPKTKKATRLPQDWTPPLEAIEWARREHPHVNLEDQTARFTDHWTAASGANARKHDWTATWRNWIRKADEIQAQQNQRAGYRTQAELITIGMANAAAWDAQQAQQQLLIDGGEHS